MLAASSQLITDVAKDSGGLSPTPQGTCRDRHVMSERRKRPGKGDLASTLQAPRHSDQSSGLQRAPAQIRREMGTQGLFDPCVCGFFSWKHLW